LIFFSLFALRASRWSLFSFIPSTSLIPSLSGQRVCFLHNDTIWACRVLRFSWNFVILMIAKYNVWGCCVSEGFLFAHDPYFSVLSNSFLCSLPPLSPMLHTSHTNFSFPIIIFFFVNLLHLPNTYNTQRRRGFFFWAHDQYFLPTFPTILCFPTPTPRGYKRLPCFTHQLFFPSYFFFVSLLHRTKHIIQQHQCAGYRCHSTWLWSLYILMAG